MRESISLDILGNVNLTRTILEDNNADDGDFGDGLTAVPLYGICCQSAAT